jgi:hypothetical protein
MVMSTVVGMIVGTFDASYQLQVSPDNATWFSIGAAMTDAGAAVVMTTDSTAKFPAALWARASTASSDYTSGTPTVIFVGSAA